MSTIQHLNDKFGLKDQLSFTIGDGSFTFIGITNSYGNASICLYGAHLTSYQPKNEKEVLWMSPNTIFEEGKPIRGGIPVCFPWFGPHSSDPKLPQHGFGRLMNWTVTKTESNSSGETVVVLQLCSSEETKRYSPIEFEAEMTFVIGAKLQVQLSVTNKANEPMEYSCALHTYYNLSDIKAIKISGLEGAAFHSQLEPGDFVQEVPQFEIYKAETRHYHNTLTTCEIYDPGFQRKIIVGKEGSKITTVWNPWAETCSQIADLPDDGYKTFVCIEAVNAFDDTITLASGDCHATRAIIGVEN